MTHRRDTPLDTDPALAEALAGWRTQGRLSDEAVRNLRSRRRRVVTSGAGSAAAILLTIGMFSASPPASPDRVANLQTGRGEMRTIRLPDGTKVRLEGATRLSVRYGAGARAVMLADGAAMFDVTHDPARPFTVRAGDGDVRVLGTAFRVDRTPGRMAIEVHRGAVRLSAQRDARSERIPAGWAAQVVAGHVGRPARFDMAGRSGEWIDTDGLRLGDLVAILNRGPGRRILPPPPALSDMSISGRFRTDDPRSLLGSLGMSYGFSVIIHDDTLRLSPI